MRGIRRRSGGVVRRGDASESEEDDFDSLSPATRSRHSPVPTLAQSPPPTFFTNYTLDASIPSPSSDLDISPFDQRDPSPSFPPARHSSLPGGHPASRHSRFQSLGAVNDFPFLSLSPPPTPAYPARPRSPSPSHDPESPSFCRARFIDSLRSGPPPPHDIDHFFDSASESSESAASREHWSDEDASGEGMLDGSKRVSAVGSFMADILQLYSSGPEDEAFATSYRLPQSIAESDPPSPSTLAPPPFSYPSHWQSGYSLSNVVRPRMDSQAKGLTFIHQPQDDFESPPESPLREGSFASRYSFSPFDPISSLPSPPTTPRRTSPADLAHYRDRSPSPLRKPSTSSSHNRPLTTLAESKVPPVAIVVARRMSFTPSTSISISTRNVKSLRLSSMAPRTFSSLSSTASSPTRPGDTRVRSQVVHLVRIDGVGSPPRVGRIASVAMTEEWEKEGEEGRLGSGGKKGFDRGEIGDWLMRM